MSLEPLALRALKVLLVRKDLRAFRGLRVLRAKWVRRVSLARKEPQVSRVSLGLLVRLALKGPKERQALQVLRVQQAK